MSDERQHEVLLDTINETQKILDEIFIYIDKNPVGELKAGMIALNLSNSNMWAKQAKDYLTD